MMRAMKSRELLLSNSLFQVARLTFEGPNGGEIVREVIERERPDAVCIELDEGRVLDYEVTPLEESDLQDLHAVLVVLQPTESESDTRVQSFLAGDTAG